MTRRHPVPEALGTRKVLEIHRDVDVGFRMPLNMRRDSSAETKAACSDGSSLQEAPMLKGGGGLECFHGIFTPWRIHSRTCPLAPHSFHFDIFCRTR